MKLLRDDFKAGPASQVPASWFNQVARMLNGLVASTGLFVNKEGTDTAGVEIGLEVESASKLLGIGRQTQANEDLKRNDGGDSRSRLPRGVSLDTREWVRDSTEQTKDATKAATTDEITSTKVTQVDAFAGVRFQVVSRVVRLADEDVFFWRWAYFDCNGMLFKLSGEQGCYSEVNYDNY